MSSMIVALAQPQTLPMHSTGMDVGGEYFLVFWPWLADLGLIVCYWKCSHQVSFLSSSLGAHHAFPCHLPLVECLHLLALSHPFLVLPSPASHQNASWKNILCCLICFSSTARRHIPKSFPNNIIICSRKLSWPSVAPKRPLDPVPTTGTPAPSLAPTHPVFPVF